VSAQHTPGPWFIGKYGRVTTPSGETLRTCGIAIPGADCDEYRANARLIAAAPDGLEAAHEALIALEDAPDDSMTVQIARKKLRAFIDKATGAQS